MMATPEEEREKRLTQEYWVARQKMHYGGKIDWQEEYQRLLNVAEQAVQAPTSACAMGILKEAVECGHLLLQADSEEET